MWRLMTLNLNYRLDGYGSWEVRRERLTELLLRAEPDAVALQAVARGSAGKSQVEELAESTGYPYASFVVADSHQDLGSGWLAREAPRETRTWAVAPQPTESDPSGRVFIACGFPQGQGTLWAINAHCSWVPAQNAAQIEALLSFSADLPGAAVILGDFNATPKAATLDALRRAGWEDSWEICHPGEAGPTFLTTTPEERIDYLWTRAGVARARALEVLPLAGPPVSDHRALLGVVELA